MSTKFTVPAASPLRKRIEVFVVAVVKLITNVCVSDLGITPIALSDAIGFGISLVLAQILPVKKRKTIHRKLRKL